GPLPDPIVPLSGSVRVPAEGENIKGQKSGSLHAEIYVPHDIKAGDYKGRLTLEAGEQSLALDVALRVWDFTLPDYLSFLPEMNCYGLPANERAYYRLAHLHRTVLNREPYSQNGSVHDGCAPGWDGRKLDWSAWDPVSVPTSMAPRSPTCRAAVCRLRGSICRCSRTGPRRWPAITTAPTGPIKRFRPAIAVISWKCPGR